MIVSLTVDVRSTRDVQLISSLLNGTCTVSNLYSSVLGWKHCSRINTILSLDVKCDDTESLSDHAEFVWIIYQEHRIKQGQDTSKRLQLINDLLSGLEDQCISYVTWN